MNDRTNIFLRILTRYSQELERKLIIAALKKDAKAIRGRDFISKRHRFFANNFLVLTTNARKLTFPVQNQIAFNFFDWRLELAGEKLPSADFTFNVIASR